MPVDRSLLPPLPGKPDWYVENAPHAIDLGPEERSEDAPRRFGVAPVPMQSVQAPLPPREEPAPEYGEVSVYSTPQFPTGGTHPDHHGRKLGKVKALAGRFKH